MTRLFCTMLVIADEIADVVLLRRELEKIGEFEMYLLEANGCDEGLRALQQKGLTIDIVFLALMGDSRDGINLLKRVRKQSEFPPVVLLAEQASERVVADAMDAGASDVLLRLEITPDRLRSVITHAIPQLDDYCGETWQAEEMQRTLRSLQKQNFQLQQDLVLAQRIQGLLIPKQMPQVPGLKLEALYEPMQVLGGDYYDVLSLDDGVRLGVLIADVSGHGASAALITAMAKVSFRNACAQNPEPSSVLERMHTELSALLDKWFMTACYCVIDGVSQRMTYASAGHCPLLVHRSTTGELMPLVAQSTFLGGLDVTGFTSNDMQLEPGDRLLWFTDGLSECANPQQETLGLNRLYEIVKETACGDASPWLPRIRQRVAEFCMGQTPSDDISAVSLRVELPGS